MLITAHKTASPSTVVKFLGVELGMMERVLRLSEEKLHRLQRNV